MGNNNKKIITERPLQQAWRFTNNHPLPLDNIYQHVQNGTLGQKSIIRVNPRYTVDQQLSIYQWRKANNSSLVQTYDAQQIQYSQEKKKQKNQLALCIENHDLTVISQPIIKKFSQLPQLTFPQTLYALRQSLKAYEQVFTRIGAIHVSGDIIGLNRFGQIKCWINPNWAENHPLQQMQRKILMSTKNIPFQRLDSKASDNKINYSMIEPKYRDETQMSRNVIDIIQGKCQKGRFPNDFSNYIFINGNRFQKARQFLQNFIVKNRIRVPNKILENYIQETISVRAKENLTKGSQQLISMNKQKQDNYNDTHHSHVRSSEIPFSKSIIQQKQSLKKSKQLNGIKKNVVLSYNNSISNFNNSYPYNNVNKIQQNKTQYLSNKSTALYSTTGFRQPLVTSVTKQANTFNLNANNKNTSNIYTSFNPQYYLTNKNPVINIPLQNNNYKSNTQMTESITVRNSKLNNQQSLQPYKNYFHHYSNRSLSTSNLNSYTQPKKYQYTPSYNYTNSNFQPLNKNPTVFSNTTYSSNTNPINKNININQFSSEINRNSVINQPISKNTSRNLSVNFGNSNYHKNVSLH